MIYITMLYDKFKFRPHSSINQCNIAIFILVIHENLAITTGKKKMSSFMQICSLTIHLIALWGIVFADHNQVVFWFYQSLVYIKCKSNIRSKD